jgi:hypothetical protein
MKAKHTPPPWTSHHFIRDDMALTDLGLYEIEEVNERFRDILADDPMKMEAVIAEAEANRRLIEAAPHLLAACEVRVRLDITSNIVAEPWHVVAGDGTIISSHAEPMNAIAAAERIRESAIAAMENRNAT